MFISIIVPVFNTEKFLPECIDSILSQSYTDFELLLVDDGSTDGSGKICDNCAQRDGRVRVFHKSNGGASSARNLGLDNAQGEWICFVDSDDYVEPAYLETLFSRACKADITFFPVKKIFENGDVNLLIPKACIVNNRVEVEQQLAHLKYGMSMDLFGWPTDKIFNAAIIRKHNVRFPEDVVFREDEIFTMIYSRYISSLEILDTPLYNYRVVQGGLTSKGILDSDYLALSDHLLENLPFFQNQQLLSGDKRRIIDYRIQHILKDRSIKKFTKFYPSLYKFAQAHKSLLPFSNSPYLARRLSYPFWISYVIFFLSIIKSFIRNK